MIFKRKGALLRAPFLSGTVLLTQNGGIIYTKSKKALYFCEIL